MKNFAGSIFAFLVLLFSERSDSAETLLKPSHQWNVLAPDPEIPRFDPSALYKYQGHLLTVSDREAYNDIYELVRVDDSHYQAKIFLKVRLPSEDPEVARFDFEGLTFCQGKFFIIDEANLDVIEVEMSGKAKVHHPDITSVHKKIKMNQASGTDNGGFEGIACDEKGRNFYLAIERQFRMIYPFKFGSWVAEDFFDVPAGWNLPRLENGRRVFQDFADLQFQNASLYALQRNDRRILKIDPVAQRNLASIVLDFDEQKLYDTSDPFGLAEGLWIDDTKIYILLDNNGVKQRNSKGGISSILLEFPRPKGF